jgi:spore germination protein KB
MKRMEIDGQQLFVIIYLFELGSAILLDVGKNAEQSAWLAMLIGMVSGLLLFLVYYKLYIYYPTQLLTTYVRSIFGKYIGWMIGLLYVVYFIYITSRILRDFGGLLIITAYNKTPLAAMVILMVIVVMYVAAKGIEVIARTGQIYFVIVILTFLFVIFLEITAGIIHFKNLLPVLGKGWRPVLTTAFPTTFTVPFGEMIAFTMILPFVKKSVPVKKVSLTAIAVSGTYLALSAALNASILGADVFKRATFPVLSALSLVNMQEFLQHLDSLIVLVMIILGFFKIIIFFYAALIGTADLFNVQQPKKLTSSVAAVAVFSSVTMAANYSDHIEQGLKLVPYFLHLPFQVAIPLLLLAVALIRKKAGGKQG